MASEMAEPIDWSHPPPSWSVPPELQGLCGANAAYKLTCINGVNEAYSLCGNSGRRTLARFVLFLMSAEYSIVLCLAWPGTSETCPWHRLGMILLYCCPLSLWSRICVSDGVAASRIWSPWLVVQGQDASGQRDGGICMRWIWSISPTQVLAWLLRNAGFWFVVWDRNATLT